MPWPVDTAKAIAERIAGGIETAVLRVRPDTDPVALSRAVRSPRGMLAIIGRAVAPVVREVHDHQAWWGRQYFPDTAEHEFVLRHSGIWGVDQRAATVAIGRVTVEGVAGAALPSGLELAGSDGTLFATTEAAAIGAGGTVTVPVSAAVAGPAGNVEPGVRLRTVLSAPAVDRVTVAAGGIAGGASEETMAELAAAVVARIRQREHGGAAFDYPMWLLRRFAVAAVSVVPEWIGRGSVGVVVAMRDEDGSARAPSEAEIEAMQIYLGRFGVAEGVRPVTARVVVVPAVLRPIAATIRLRPDTTAVRAAVTEAFQRYVRTIGDADDERNDGPIGALIERSRISEAVSAASGEYAHDLLAPAAALQLDRTEMPVPGVITWAPPA